MQVGDSLSGHFCCFVTSDYLKHAFLELGLDLLEPLKLGSLLVELPVYFVIAVLAHENDLLHPLLIA